VALARGKHIENHLSTQLMAVTHEYHAESEQERTKHYVDEFGIESQSWEKVETYIAWMWSVQS
jgi:hypothetical protein